ncbi:hypothetical protein ES703_09709 [subsurface metagenome]
MKSFQSKYYSAKQRFASCCGLCFLGLLILLCHSCEKPESGMAGAIDTASKPTAIKPKQPETKPAVVEQKPKEQPLVKTTAGPSNIVAKIGEYVITREELEKKLMMELRPGYGGYGRYGKDAKPVDAKTVLLKMIAEKAMVMDARKHNLLEDETIQASLKRFKGKKLTRLLLANYLKGKIVVTESEIDEKIKANPKLSRARAKAIVGREKANKVLSQYYQELYKKLHVQKLSHNFLKAAQIHQRLLLYPKEPRKMRLIRIRQIKNELTPEEKNLVLATYDTGKVTLKDWFDALCEIGPTSRPRDLNSAAGVERLLERALSTPIFVSEAESLGLDKDENLLKEIKKQEDMHLFGKARREKTKGIPDPNEEQIVAYFEKNKEAFGTDKMLKIDQIWCQDLKTAQKVKAELASGKDFESARQEYSLQKKAHPYNASPRSEGMFFKDLWNADPNGIVGPVKGFHGDEIKWRIVKISEKKPGETKEYSSDMNNRIKSKMQQDQRNAILENYRKELLEEYSYEIYAERIRDINPLDIP